MPHADPRGTADQFGYEWARYSEILAEHKGQFLTWISPLTPRELAGRSILDVGCGSGRNSYWAARCGAAHIMACDVDERTLGAARRNLAGFSNVEVVRCSTYELPWRHRFDLVMSIGVVHHLDDPRRAVERLVEAARPGGTILIWVYGREGNEWLLRFLGPLRAVTTRLPARLTDALALAFSAPLFLFLRAFPQRHPYFQTMKQWRFGHVHQVVFDQLLPRIAHYWTRDQAIGLFDGLPITDVTATYKNQNSWTVRARRAGPA